MNHATIRPALKALVASLSGLPTYWEDQQEPAVSSTLRGVVKLRSFGEVAKGVDERVQSVSGTELTEQVRGVRLFTLRIKVESYDQRDGGTAYHFASLIRDRWSWSSARAQLLAVNVGHVRIGEVQDLGDFRDDRARSVAVLDVRLSYQTGAGSENLDPVRFPWIETVLLSEFFGYIRGVRTVGGATRTGAITP